MESARKWLGVFFGLILVLGTPVMGAEHLEPVPSIAGTPLFLEAEGATSMAPIWSSISLGGIDCVYRAPAAEGWFQYEGLSLADGNYQAYVSWTRPGSGFHAHDADDTCWNVASAALYHAITLESDQHIFRIDHCLFGYLCALQYLDSQRVLRYHRQEN